MAFVTTGLTNSGVTAHYRFSYDSALSGSGGPEPARTNAVIATCESDHALMSGWFGGGLTVTGMSVQVTTQSHGASWNGTSTSSTIELNAQGSSYSGNPAYLRYLLIAEVTEIFMMTQGRGWFQGGDEGSKGEGLSRFLSGQFLAMNGFLGLGIDADYAVADLWLNSTRQDFVNTAPDDHRYNAINRHRVRTDHPHRQTSSAARPPASITARPSTASSIGSVSRPVKVFCWLT